ncbi:hypothetical protein HMPREF9104_02119 [Lentilactobacillus kisonensis F0435]|uniref:Uncharacterized protein n=1 Tax=Lentilactobacillus kisonensis F0435 TaxID=797516 RepID=H1LHM8_9LACO|nr:hypothetical protein HMPREF9104_02119 [Lentilactobacillus kisonensis F0435]
MVQENGNCDKYHFNCLWIYLMVIGMFLEKRIILQLYRYLGCAQ